MPRHHGRMAEWLKVPPWKGGIRVLRIEGSNPSPSARIQKAESVGFLPFLFYISPLETLPLTFITRHIRTPDYFQFIKVRFPTLGWFTHLLLQNITEHLSF